MGFGALFSSSAINLISHTKPQARKWNKHAAQEVAAQPSTAGSSRVPPPLAPAAISRGGATTGGNAANSSSRAGLSSASPAARLSSAGSHQQGPRRGQGFQAADRRFASLLAKGGTEEAATRGGGGEARGLPAGIPGPWEPVAGPGEGHQYSREVPQDDRGQR